MNAEKWVIDRIEEDRAVLVNSQTMEDMSLPVAQLPEGVKAGVTLIKQNGKWYVNEADTIARAKLVAERFARIKKRAKPLK